MSRNVANQVIRGTIVIVIVSVLAKLTSFLAEMILASYLGTNAVSDAYYMVTNIQLVIYPMLGVGIWKVFLPLYKAHLAQGQLREADSLANSAISFFTLASILVVGLLILFADLVVSVVAPGFQGQTRALCIELVRISAPMYILITAAAVYASMLQCHNKFLGSQIREIASHIPTILAALLLYRKYGIRVMAIALVLGGALRLIVELPFVDWGFRFRVNLRFRTEEFKKMLGRLPAVLLTEATVKLNALIDKSMASTLPDGTISGMNYGHKLMNVFSGLLSTAVSTAMYPQMIELISKKEHEALSKLVVKVLNLFCIIMIPITIACVLFRQELVSAAFQRGAFDENSAKLTAGVFALYALGLLFIACNAVLDNLFYGCGDTKTPLYVSIAALVINVSLNLALLRVLGANGLALATSLSALITFLIRIWSSKRIIRYNRQLPLTVGKVLLCSAAACFAPRILFWAIPAVNIYLALAASGLLGVGIYFIGLRLLRVNELQDLIKLVLRKKNRRLSE